MPATTFSAPSGTDVMPAPDRLAVLELSERNEAELLLMRFDQDWHPELIGEYRDGLNSDWSDDKRQAILVELLKVDLQRAWDSGLARLLDDYSTLDDDLGHRRSWPADLVFAEFDARSRSAGGAAIEEYAVRFPGMTDEIRRLAAESGYEMRSDSTKKLPAQASVDTSRTRALRPNDSHASRSADGDLPERFGRYRIVRPLGAGAMGKVYLAQDERLDRLVALKTPTFSDADVLQRFEREARAVAKIRHPQICPVFDVGEIDGKHFISMAYVDGQCLSRQIQDSPPSKKEAATFVKEIAIALAEAHRHGIVHRDLKPSNIMIDGSGRPVVMDFGLALQIDAEHRVTQSGLAVGTPAYMSPEQIRGETETLGAASDIYSLGVILYELLTGRLPFSGPIAKVLYDIVHEQPRDPSAINDVVDDRLESICLRMMSKQSANRYESMNAVASVLDEYLATVDRMPTIVTAEPAVAEESSSRGGSRLWLLAAGLGAVALLATITVYFADGAKLTVDAGSVEVQTRADGTIQSVRASAGPKGDVDDKQRSSPPTPSREISAPEDVAERDAPAVAETVASSDSPLIIRATGGSQALAISPDGRFVASAVSGNSQRILIWETKTGRRVNQIDVKSEEYGGISKIRYSPDGTRLILSLPDQMRVLDSRTGTQKHSLSFPAVPWWDLFSERPLVMTAYLERRVHRTDAKEVPQRIRFWNWETGETVSDQNFAFKGAPNRHLSISADERFLTYSREHFFVRAELNIDGDEISLEEPVEMEKTSRIRSPLHFSPDGELGAFAIKGSQGIAGVLRIKTGKVAYWIDPAASAASNQYKTFGCRCAFGSDSRILATAYHTGRVALWNAADGTLMRDLVSFHQQDHRAPYVVSAQDVLVAAGGVADPKIYVWRLDEAVE